MELPNNAWTHLFVHYRVVSRLLFFSITTILKCTYIIIQNCPNSERPLSDVALHSIVNIHVLYITSLTHHQNHSLSHCYFLWTVISISTNSSSCPYLLFSSAETTDSVDVPVTLIDASPPVGSVNVTEVS